MRALAELENFRNRTNRLAAEERKYAGIELARDILPLWDNLSLALQNTVMVELKAGFTLHERIVRAAQVVLASAPVKPTEPQPEN